MWGGSEPVKEDPQTNAGAGDHSDDDVEEMNFAEKLSAVVGVLFVEKYEYTVDGLYYGANMVGDSVVAAKDKTLGLCGYGAEAPPAENAPEIR